MEYIATEETAAVPTTTSGTDEELREAFEEVEQEKELEELEGMPPEEAAMAEGEVSSISVIRISSPLAHSFCSDPCFVGGDPC